MDRLVTSSQGEDVDSKSNHQERRVRERRILHTSKLQNTKKVRGKLTRPVSQRRRQKKRPRSRRGGSPIKSKSPLKTHNDQSKSGRELKGSQMYLSEGDVLDSKQQSFDFPSLEESALLSPFAKRMSRKSWRDGPKGKKRRVQSSSSGVLVLCAAVRIQSVVRCFVKARSYRRARARARAARVASLAGSEAFEVIERMKINIKEVLISRQRATGAAISASAIVALSATIAAFVATREASTFLQSAHSRRKRMNEEQRDLHAAASAFVALSAARSVVSLVEGLQKDIRDTAMMPPPLPRPSKDGRNMSKRRVGERTKTHSSSTPPPTSFEASAPAAQLSVSMRFYANLGAPLAHDRISTSAKAMLVRLKPVVCAPSSNRAHYKMSICRVGNHARRSQQRLAFDEAAQGLLAYALEARLRCPQLFSTSTASRIPVLPQRSRAAIEAAPKKAVDNRREAAASNGVGESTKSIGNVTIATRGEIALPHTASTEGKEKTDTGTTSVSFAGILVSESEKNFLKTLIGRDQKRSDTSAAAPLPPTLRRITLSDRDDEMTSSEKRHSASSKDSRSHRRKQRQSAQHCEVGIACRACSVM
eukprot:g137.t1